MTETISITPHWQIHLPVSFRKALGLITPGLVEITLVKDEIVLKPKKSPILKMAGKYQKIKPVKKVNLDQIRDYIDYSSI